MNRLTNTVVRPSVRCLGALMLVLIISGFVPGSTDHEEFLYLAGVVHDATDGAHGQDAKARALTDWLAANVLRTNDYPGWEKDGYPDWFDPSSYRSIIEGGMANCGYKSSILLALASYVNVSGRRYHMGSETGGTLEHVFTELYTDGKLRVYDADLLGYQAGPDGQTMGLASMVADPDAVANPLFRRMVKDIRENPKILRLSTPPAPPKPLGHESYLIYSAVGEGGTRAYLHVLSAPFAVFGAVWACYLVLNYLIQ